MTFKRRRFTEAVADGELYSSTNLTISREGGALKFDFNMPGWYHDTQDPSEAAGIIKGSKYKDEPEVQQIELTDADKSNINISEFLYWLSGGNRQWSPGGDNDFNVGWDEVEPVLTEKFGNKFSALLKSSATLGELIKVYEDEKEDFIYDFYDVASEQGWEDEDEEYRDEKEALNNKEYEDPNQTKLNFPESRMRKMNKNSRLSESKKRAINSKVTRILKKIIKEEYGKLIRENEMSDNVQELTMFADNDHKLYKALMDNYLKNMLTKKKRGVYDHNLAIKLLEYYYQNYVRPEYKRQHGDDIKLSPAERKQFAEYYVNALEETEEFQNQETKQLK